MYVLAIVFATSAATLGILAAEVNFYDLSFGNQLYVKRLQESFIKLGASLRGPRSS